MGQKEFFFFWGGGGQLPPRPPRCFDTAYFALIEVDTAHVAIRGPFLQARHDPGSDLKLRPWEASDSVTPLKTGILRMSPLSQHKTPFFTVRLENP